MSTLEEARSVQTVEEIRDELLDGLVEQGVSATGWTDESTHRGLVELFARAQASEQGIRSQLATASSRALIMQMEDLALRDAWLGFLARGWYGLDFLPATFTTQRFVLACSAAGGPYTIAPRALRAQDEDGVVFRNTGRLTSDLAAGVQTVVLPPGGTLNELEWVAEVAGTSGNIPAGSTLSLITTLAGVTVTNPQIGSSGSAILTAGADIETAESLDARCAARWDRTAVGQLPGALVLWIFESFEVDGLTCTITKWRVDDENPNGPGSADVWLANADGPATVAEVARVNAYMQARWGAGTGVLRVMAATERVVPFTARLFALDRSESNIADAEAVIATLESITPLGSTRYSDDVTKALRSIPDLYHVEHDFPTTALGPSEVLTMIPTFEEV
jgi:hypothetical protein